MKTEEEIKNKLNGLTYLLEDETLSFSLRAKIKNDIINLSWVLDDKFHKPILPKKIGIKESNQEDKVIDFLKKNGESSSKQIAFHCLDTSPMGANLVLNRLVARNKIIVTQNKQSRRRGHPRFYMINENEKTM